MPGTSRTYNSDWVASPYFQPQRNINVPSSPRKPIVWYVAQSLTHSQLSPELPQWEGQVFWSEQVYFLTAISTNY